MIDASAVHAPGALHVTNGDSTVAGLRATGLSETILAWRDVLHEVRYPQSTMTRSATSGAAFLAEHDAGDIGTRAAFAARDETLADHRDGGYVLWFEADLYDQLQLVQILARLRALGVRPERITLICVGEYAGIAHFGGLGELTGEQLGRLPEIAAIPLTACRARARRSGVGRFSGARAVRRRPDRVHALAGAALRRRGLRSAGPRVSVRARRPLPHRAPHPRCSQRGGTAGDAFVRGAARETRPFLGDTWCFDRIARLLGAPTPLLARGSGAGQSRGTRR